jgi:hypothetical protein
MKSICFFCHFHNGDIFHIKSFLKDIMSQIDTKYYIAHSNSEILTCDMDLEYINLPSFCSKFNEVYEKNRELNKTHVDLLVGKEYTKFVNTDECFYINTWIGGYFSPENEYTNECSLRGFHKMFQNIYENINQEFGENLQLKELNEYIPFVDYSKIDCEKIDSFVEKNPYPKVLICNGPALSKQTVYNSDMSEIIVPLAENNKDKIFICTKKFETESENVKFTDDIFKLDRCDLNEISYLSKFCYLIVGRNSGPFCFTITKENLNDESKTFLSFGSRETDCLPYQMEIDASFVFDYFTTIKNLNETISELI